MKRKLCSIFLALVIILSMAVPALSAEPPQDETGNGMFWADDARVAEGEDALYKIYTIFDTDLYSGLDSFGATLRASAALVSPKGTTSPIGFANVGAANTTFWANGEGKFMGYSGVGGEDEYGIMFKFMAVEETTPMSITSVDLFKVIDKTNPDNEIALPKDDVSVDNIGDVIVQYPVTVTVGNGGTVSTKTTDYATATATPTTHTTYNVDGTAGDVETDDVIWVDSGVSQQNKVTFSITPDTHYTLKDILVDGTSVGAGAVLTASENGSYETAGIAAETDIEFQFEKSVSFVTTTVKTYTDGVAATSTVGGVISYGGDELAAEDTVEVLAVGNQIFTITPNEGYQIKKVTVDGVEKTALAGKTDERTVAINISNLEIDHEILVEYEKIVYTIETTVEPAGAGTITGPESVEYGANAVYTFAPKDSTVKVTEVWVDGVKLTNPDTTGYTFTNVTEDHTLKVVFGNAISEIIVDPDAGFTMDGEKALIILRGEWANEKTFTEMLSSVKINGGQTPVDKTTVTLSLGSATAYDFPASVVPVALDATNFGQINVLQSGIVEVTVTAIADTSKSVTFVFIVPGDITRDGRILPDDASYAGDVYLGDRDLQNMGKYAKELSDMNKDGVILPDDASIIGEIYMTDKVI